MIYVIKNNKYFGKLTEVDGPLITFTYDDSITASEYVSSLKEKVNTSDVLFPVFENMLPEHDHIKLLKKKYDITNNIDVLAYFDNVHGTYEFFDENGIKDFESTTWEIFSFDDAKDEILDNKYIFPNILNNYTLNISDDLLYPIELKNSNVVGLSGYQYKFSVIKDDVNKEIKECPRNKSTNFLMKPYSEYYSTYNFKEKNRSYIPYLLINEHLFMTLARDFGFDIPYNGIIKHKTDYHYIIKRFDRYKTSKIDHVELLTLMNKKSDQKYKVTMQDVLKTAQKYIGASELLNLFKFVVFSIVIGHGDLHAKNLSLIYHSNNANEEKMNVSPFYDISTTKIYKDTKTNDIGLKMLNRTFNIKRKDIVDVGEIIGISKDITVGLIDELTTKFFKEFTSYIKLLPEEIKALAYYEGSYGRFKPLETILNEYYTDRVKYINDNLVNIKLVDDLESEDEFWK